MWIFLKSGNFFCYRGHVCTKQFGMQQNLQERERVSLALEYRDWQAVMEANLNDSYIVLRNVLRV